MKRDINFRQIPEGSKVIGFQKPDSYLSSHADNNNFFVDHLFILVEVPSGAHFAVSFNDRPGMHLDMQAVTDHIQANVLGEDLSDERKREQEPSRLLIKDPDDFIGPYNTKGLPLSKLSDDERLEAIDDGSIVWLGAKWKQDLKCAEGFTWAEYNYVHDVGGEMKNGTLYYAYVSSDDHLKFLEGVKREAKQELIDRLLEFKKNNDVAEDEKWRQDYVELAMFGIRASGRVSEDEDIGIFYSLLTSLGEGTENEWAKLFKKERVLNLLIGEYRRVGYDPKKSRELAGESFEAVKPKILEMMQLRQKEKTREHIKLV